MIEKSIKKDDEECRLFLEIEGNETKMKTEIRKCYNYITTNYLTNTLTELLQDIKIYDDEEKNKKEKEKIKEELPNNIKEIIENLNPLYQCFSSSMNINDLIKVKMLKDNSFKSEVFRGFAMTKQVCSKNMEASKKDSNILLLDFDFNKHEIRDILDLSKKYEKKKNKKDKENENINSKKFGSSLAENIYKDIESLDVNIILISKGIDNKLLDIFTEKSELNSKSKPIIAIDVKSSSLEKIAFCTKGKVINSLEEFKNYIKERNTDKDKKSNFLGFCKVFQITDIKKFTDEKEETFKCYDNIDKYKKEEFEKAIYRPKYRLMKFESRLNSNFQTLLISSNNKKLLKILKKALKEEIFITVRDFFLQQKVLHYLFCNIEFKLPTGNKNNEKTDFKPYLIRERIEIEKRKANITQKNSNENQSNKIDDLNNNNNNKKDNEIIKNEENTEQNKNIPSQSEKMNNIKINSQGEEINSNNSVNSKPQLRKRYSSSSISELSLLKKELESLKINNTRKNLSQNNQGNSESSNNTSNKTKFSLKKEISKGFESIDNMAYKDSRTSNVTSFELVEESCENNIIDNETKKEYEKYLEYLWLQQNQSNNNYLFGFDTSIIINTNKADEINENTLKLRKLRMCQRDKNFNQVKTDVNDEKTDKNNKQVNIKNEAELLKKLNYICGNAENLEIKFYETNSGRQSDKQFGKFIFDMIAEKNNICDNDKCKKKISKHFYYLYNSDFSRIKISYITKDNDYLNYVIKYINSKDGESEYFEKLTQINEDDYKSDIYSYGFCTICKKIATPLIKLPKDFFAYSTGKFLSHLFYNKEMKNRNEIEFNLWKSYKEQEKKPEVYITNTCEDNCFHDINRIFITKFGALKFGYEKLKLNIFLSVQQSTNNNNDHLKDLKEKKSINTINSKDIRQGEESKFDKFFEIIDFIKDKFSEELKNINNIKPNIEEKEEEEIKEKTEKVEETNEKKSEKININFIIDSIINLLTEVQNYMIPLKEKNSNPSTLSINQKLGITNNSSNESKDKYFNSCDLREQIETFNSIDDSKLFGLKKRIAFRIVQLKFLYNNIRVLIHKIKLYISIENKIKTVKKDKSENNVMDTERPFKENPTNLNLKPEEKNPPTPPENIIKNLIENYITLGAIHGSENKNDKKSEEYLKILDTLTFYEEKPNENSNIIKENDLSSIIYYGISSNNYKNYMKGKTNLLEYKNNERDSNTNSTPNKPFENDKIDNASTKIDPLLYETLLVFDSQKFIDKKNNPRLEAEILNKEATEPLKITIKSINQQKFIPNYFQSRRQTISIPASVSSSPKTFSPKKLDDEIEKKLDIIEERISGFFNKMVEIRKAFNNLNKSKKFFGKTVEDFSAALKNVSTEYNESANNNLDNKEDNNKSEEAKKAESDNINKRIVLDNLIASFDEKIKSVQNNIFFQPKQDINKQNLENLDLKEEDGEEGGSNIINLIGNLHHLEDYIPKSEIDIKIYYPRQFEALRIVYCSTYEDLLASMLESSVWSNVSGGKSKATFYKTKDEKYLFKSINRSEFQMFLEMAFHYFQHMDEYLFHKMPSLLTKTLGVYEIHMKKTGKEENYYIMMMENLNYGLNLDDINSLKSYDLKGSLSNRYVSKPKQQQPQQQQDLNKNENEIKKNINKNIVLHDSNFKEDNKNEPIPLNKEIYDILLIAVHNDTLLLSKIGIVDYSLLLHIYQKDNANYLRMGIIDYVRKYTWDKQLEHAVKIILNGFKAPTIVDPKEYKKRFNEAIKDYFIGI